MLLKYLDVTWTVWLRARPHRYLADSTLIELHWKVDLGFLLIAPGPYVNGGDFVPSRTISHTMKIHVRLKLRSAVEPLHFQTSAVPTSTVGSQRLSVLAASSAASCDWSGSLLWPVLFKKNQCPSVCCWFLYSKTLKSIFLILYWLFHSFGA